MAESNETNWGYKPDTPEPPAAAGSFSWEAPEYIIHHHGAGWYLALTILTAAAAAGVFFISSQDIIAPVIVALLGLAVGIFASHKPATVQYQINATGIIINGKAHKYGDYKSFSIIREPQISSLNLTPLKRLMPPLAVNYDPINEKKILEVLGDRLPYDNRPPDAVDRWARRLRL